MAQININKCTFEREKIKNKLELLNTWCEMHTVDVENLV